MESVAGVTPSGAAPAFAQNHAMTADLSVLTATDLRQLGAWTGEPCPRCAALACPGWEAIPGTYDRDNLQRVGTLRDPGNEDPTLEEYHPDGTHGWSPQAPIAPRHFPYNRCEAWTCVGCGRPFLRYTEYGGYYVEERVRELRAERVVAAA